MLPDKSIVRGQPVSSHPFTTAAREASTACLAPCSTSHTANKRVKPPDPPVMINTASERNYDIAVMMSSSALFKHTTNRRTRPHTALQRERLGGLGPFDTIFKLWRKKVITNNCLSSPLLCEILFPFPKTESSYDRAEGSRWSKINHFGE